MRYTRLEINNRVTNIKHNTLFWFFIIIPLISITLGGLGAKFLISPYIKSYSGKVNVNSIAVEAKPDNVGQRKPINELFFLQAGVFANKENAKEFKNVIKEKGFTPFIVHEGDKYKVIISFSENKNILSNDRDKLNKIGYSTIVNSLSVLTGVATEVSDDKVVNEYVTCLNNILSVQLEAIERITSGKDVDKALLNSQISNLIEGFKVVNNQMANKELIETISTLNNEFTNKHNEYKKYLENNNVEELKRTVFEEAALLEGFFKKI